MTAIALSMCGGFHMASGGRKVMGRTHRDNCSDGHSCICVKGADVITPHELASMLPEAKTPLDILLEKEAAGTRNIAFL